MKHISSRLEELRLELSGNPVPKQGPTLLSDYVELWIERKAKRLRLHVLHQYTDVLGKRVVPVLGHIQVEELSRAHIEAWVSWAEAQKSRHDQPYAHATLHSWWRVMVNCLRDAAAEFNCPDPIRRVKPPRSSVKNVTEQRALSAEQLKTVLASIKRHFPNWYAEVHIIAYTGMRPSELYALKWDDVDYTRKVFIQRESVDQAKDVNPPKTGVEREIGLTDKMVELLKEHRQRLLHEQHPGLKLGLVFPNNKGGYRISPSMLKILRLAAAAVHIPIRVGPKTLRKTFITLAALAGLDRLTIRANVGHCDEEMTERYAWVSADEKRRLAQGI